MNIKENSLIRTVVYRWRNFRSRHSYIRGSGNSVVKKGIVRVNSLIQIDGNGNKLSIERGSVLKNTLIRIHGSNNEVRIRSNAFISGAELWVEDNGCVMEIGEKTFVGHHSHLACTEGSSLVVGRDGMISSYVQIRTGDSHSILDMEGNRINQAAPVCIGNHVWIGEGAKILKGVSLPQDTIVSTGAIVTKSFEESSVLIAGVPAAVIKRNIQWDSKRI